MYSIEPFLRQIAENVKEMWNFFEQIAVIIVTECDSGTFLAKTRPKAALEKEAGPISQIW
jgi:hypothetical protein